jgi:hypothetical protein
MQLVIATGCSLSGWEIILPVLARMGLETAKDDLLQWDDSIHDRSLVPDLRSINKTTQPPRGMIECINELLKKPSETALFLADSNHLHLLDFWAAQYPQAIFLLFYTSAELVAAEASLKELDPQEFLDVWQESNHALLRFQRNHRNSTLLLDAQAAVQQPGELVFAGQKYGLNLRNHGTAAGSPVVPTLESWLLQYWVESQSAIKFLQSQLEASAYPLGGSPLPKQYQPMELIRDFKKRVTDEYKIQIEALKNDNQQLKKEINSATYQNDLLLEQLHQVQEELETVFLQKHGLEAEREQVEQLRKNLLDKERKLLEQDRFLIMLKESIFWKMTAPLRPVVRLFRRRKKTRIKAELILVKNSGFFDENWYLGKYSDVKVKGMDPVKHYLYFGAEEGRNPSPEFNTRDYLRLNPDVAEAGINPLVHYIQFGRAEGRSTRA